jgi:hypothetical protein
MITGLTWRPSLPLLVAAAAAAAAILAAIYVDPIAQDPAYHRFADPRSFFSVPNFLDVMSNIPFAIVGVAGLIFIARHGATTTHGARPAWFFFFTGVFLTAFGSGYYHADPNNETLLWDRLPMSIVFMSFLAIVVGEYLSASLGRRMLLPLLLVGVSSVFYWSYTESLGRGDLRAYAAVQFLPVLLIPMTVLMYRERSGLGRYIGLMILFYVVAKLLEFFDTEVFAAGKLVSGHSLKHLVASLAPASLLYGLMQRRYHAARPSKP